MKITVGLTLLKRKKKKNGEIPIYLRFTQNRKSRYLSTGFSIDEKYWNPTAKHDRHIRRTHDRHEVLNNELRRQKEEAEDAMLQITANGKMPTTAQIKSVLTGGQSIDFFQYAQKHIGRLQTDGRYWPAKASKNAVAKFKRMRKGKPLPLTDMSVETINSYVSYLKKIGNGPNTISKAVERIKMIIDEAYIQELIEKNPFDRFKPVKRVRTEKTRLALDQIKAVEELKLEAGSSLWHSRNYFLFAFYNAGVRFGDLARLKWTNIQDGRLKYQMGKTSTYKNIKLLPQAWAILEHYKGYEYIFPILDDGMTGDTAYRRIGSRNAVVNRDLKAIGKLAGIESPVSFHCARHSFAEYARSKGMSIYDISKALAHSDIKITQQYLKSFDENSLDNAMNELFNGD